MIRTYSSLSLLATLVVLMAWLPSCTRHVEIPLDRGLSRQIQNIAPQPVIDSLRKYGAVIHEGFTPPNIEGIYLCSPHILIGTNLLNDFPIGEKFANTKYRFYNQDLKNLGIQADYKSLEDNGSDGAETVKGEGAFMAGNGNFFTLFVEVVGTSSGIQFKGVNVYSGEITPNGIRDFQWGFYIREKEPDPANTVVPIGTTRVFQDNDGIAERVGVYRLAVPESNGVNISVATGKSPLKMKIEN